MSPLLALAVGVFMGSVGTLYALSMLAKATATSVPDEVRERLEDKARWN